jgi:hypothetical protein
MAADVSSMVNSSSNSEILITKDLLGGFSKVSNKDLDLDQLQVTKTWDVPLNLKVWFYPQSFLQTRNNLDSLSY